LFFNDAVSDAALERSKMSSSPSWRHYPTLENMRRLRKTSARIFGWTVS